MPLMIGENKAGQTIGVKVDNEGNLLLNNADSANVDAFGRQRVSAPVNRFDVEFIYDKQPTFIDEVVAGNATATHSANSRDVTLAIVETDDGTDASLYSFDIPYTPGSGQLIDITGTLDEAAIGGGTAYVFFRTNVTGSVVTTRTDQTDWNASTVSDVDWTTSQIFSIDFQSLKVGRIRYAMVRDGLPVFVHEITNDNTRASGYWQLASLPVHWRIYNAAGVTYMEMGYGDDENAVGFGYRFTANAGAKLRAICATVKSEGGAELLDIPGFTRSIDTALTATTISTTLIPILSIRPAATFNSITNKGLYIPQSYSIQSNNPLRYVLLYRPTLTDASWTAVDATNSAMQYDVSATALTGGILIDSDYFSTGRNVASNATGLLGRTLLRRTRTGTSDILTIAAIRNGAQDAAVFAAIKWKEIR